MHKVDWTGDGLSSFHGDMVTRKGCKERLVLLVGSSMSMNSKTLQETGRSVGVSPADSFCSFSSYNLLECT